MLDIAKAKKLVDQCWADEILPTSVEYIKIPNKSPAFDPDWAAHGYIDDAVALLEALDEGGGDEAAFPGEGEEIARVSLWTR
jgi:hypothetical protein